MLHRQVIGVNHITGLLILFSHVCAKAQLASFPGGLFCTPVADVCEKECVLHRLPVMVSHPGNRRVTGNAMSQLSFFVVIYPQAVRLRIMVCNVLPCSASS